MKTAPKTASKLKQEAASLGLKKNKKLTKPREQLITIIESSRQIKRQIGHATILLFGPSGSGKSSTINHVFNQNHDFATSSEDYSATRNITEYIITNDCPEYNVKDVSLGVIDCPGFADTLGLAQDACNLVAIKSFFKEKKERKKVFPNLIFVAVHPGDQKFDSPNSHLTISLKCLQKLKLVDKKNPNVVGVITHAGALGHKKDRWISMFEDKSKRLKKLIQEQLKVKAQVVALENKPDDHELEIDGDYSILPDTKTQQPRNLYDVCAKLLKRNGDEFGLLALNAAFTGSTQKPEIGEVFCPIDAENEKLGDKEKKYMEFCLRVCRGEEVDDYLSSEEDDDNIPMVKEDEDNKVLHDGKRFLTEGYDVISEEILPDQIFESNVRPNDCGIHIPVGAMFSRSGTTENLQETYSNKEERICSRMERYKIGVKASFQDSTQAGAGYVRANEIANATKEFSYTVEHRLFQAEIGTEKLKSLLFTNGFREAVGDLPYDPSNMDAFKQFFDIWGCYVITRAFVGGSIEMTVKMSAKDSKENRFKGLDLGVEVGGLLSGVGASAGAGVKMNSQVTEQRSKILESCKESFKGGDEGLHSKCTISNSMQMQKWRDSIKYNPVMLKKDLTLTPISRLVGYIDKGKELPCSTAMEKYLDNRKSNKRKSVLVHIDKKENGCFPGSAMVQQNKDGVLIDIEMKNLAVGDLIETKKGFSKVLLFAHHAPEKILKCLKISTVDGHCLRLTGNHLIFVSSDKHTKLAYNVQPGDKVISQGKEKISEVVSVEEVTEAGLFCPITEDGTIYVDGILTSCYASCKPLFNIDAHHLAHLGLLPMRIVNLKSGQVEEMHPYIKFLDQLPLPFRV